MTAGDTVSFAVSPSECSPADGWALAYRLFGPIGAAAPAGIDVALAVAVDGSAWTATLTAAQTTPVVADGTYRLTGRATNATTSEARSVYNGTLRILANPTTATPSTLVTHNERTLALIEAAIERRVPADMQSYQIDGRVVTKIPIKELLGLRAHYKHLVWKQRNPGKSAPSRRVRFGAV